MTHTDIAVEQVCNWRAQGLTPRECLQAMNRRAPWSADWFLVRHVVEQEAAKMARLCAHPMTGPA